MTLAELLRKYLDDELSPEELRLFREAAMQQENREELDRLLAAWVDRDLLQGGAEDIDVEGLYEELTMRYDIPAYEPGNAVPRVRGRSRGPRLFLLFATAAACMLAVAGIFLIHRSTLKPMAVSRPVVPAPVIIPAGNKAVLTLADGSHIVLDSAADGRLARQGNMQVIKVSNGQLQYKAEQSAAAAPLLYNEIATPRGGFYELILPDGSKVWLDAASSLRYPTAFNGTGRSVDLTGEAYFEVVADHGRPFLINTQGVTVQVLGTQLNLMAYSDEDAIRTTLVSGAVRVVRGGDSRQIRPGEQAAWVRGVQHFQVSVPDMKQVLAWKRLEFRFEGLPLDAIMRQIGRWYDVDIEYRGPQPVGDFFGVISRKQRVNDLLTVLEQTDIVHFTLEGRKIIVERRL